MRNFCSVADNNFYTKVAALDKSLNTHSTEYTLHLLCLDEQIYNNFSKNTNIKCYKLADLLSIDSNLKRSSNNEPSREALIVAQNDHSKAKQIQFTWSLAPYFTWWCLDNLECDDILYIDGDIFFYSSLDSLYSNLEDCSVGIVEHRCPYNPANGKYNVGIVYFKNDLDGYKCSTWWKNSLLFTNHEYYSTHGGCGDQKYLELFSVLFQNVKVLDEHIGHLAPWNFLHHQYHDGKIIWNSKKQDLLYCHFSNFKYNDDRYILARRHGFETPPNDFIETISDKYYNTLRKVK